MAIAAGVAQLAPLAKFESWVDMGNFLGKTTRRGAGCACRLALATLRPRPALDQLDQKETRLGVLGRSTEQARRGRDVKWRESGKIGTPKGDFVA
jgi:hypothetical protein